MKKNISLIPMDSAFETWLLEKLMKEPPESDCAEGLLSGIWDMLNREMSSLLSSSPSEAEAPVPVPLGEMRPEELEVYPRGRRVTMQGVKVGLAPEKFEILYFFTQNQGEIFTKEQIYRTVWAGDYLLNDGNIMAFIRKLRKKIEPDSDTPKYILAIWGIGHKSNDRL